MLTTFSHNGALKPIEEATMDVRNIAFTYGFGVYENIRVHQKIPYFCELHIERLMHSALLLALSHTWTPQTVQAAITELVEALEEETYNLKILLIGGKEAEDAQLFILPLAPRFPDRQWYKTGVKTVTVDHERLIPQAKTLNMLGSYLAMRTAREQDCYDALLRNRHGHLTEGTRTNLFAVRDGELVTPPSDDILAGVTRKLVLEVAKEQGISIQEEPIISADIERYDGFFLTSTSSKIMPIRQIDHSEFSIPDLTRELMEGFREFLTQQP